MPQIYLEKRFQHRFHPFVRRVVSLGGESRSRLFLRTNRTTRFHHFCQTQGRMRPHSTSTREQAVSLSTYRYVPGIVHDDVPSSYEPRYEPRSCQVRTGTQARDSLNLVQVLQVSPKRLPTRKEVSLRGTPGQTGKQNKLGTHPEEI